MKHICLLLIYLSFFSLHGMAQTDSARLANIDRKLERLVKRDSTFRRTVDVTAGRLPLSELLRNIARASGVNLSVRSVENTPVSCNFTRAQVDDLLRFLCREYRLDVDVVGNIVSIYPAAPVTVRPDPDISYNPADTTLRYDLSGEKLIDVTKKITDLSGRNIIIPQSLYDYKVSGYIRSMPFAGAMQTLASVNGLVAERDAEEVWSIYRSSDEGENAMTPAYTRRRQFSPNELLVDSLGRISAHILRGNVQDIILDLCDQLELNYYFQSPVNLSSGIFVDNTDFETLLSVLLKRVFVQLLLREGDLCLRGRAERQALGCDCRDDGFPFGGEGRRADSDRPEARDRDQAFPRSEQSDLERRQPGCGPGDDLPPLHRQAGTDDYDGDHHRRRNQERYP